MYKEVTPDCIPESTVQSDTKSNSLLSWLSNVWAYLVQHFARGHEPRIWQKRNAAGDVFYHAYDPCTRRSAYLTSDTDLRTWLEQLPYH